MKYVFSLLVAAALLMTLMSLPAEPRGPQDFEAQVRLRREQALREKEQEELKAATKELEELTGVLVERVALADGYTTDAKILEYSDQVQELAKEIEDLAKTINQRARGR
jgi:hypothetical protein